jgi:hypothetical protein
MLCAALVACEETCMWGDLKNILDIVIEAVDDASSEATTQGISIGWLQASKQESLVPAATMQNVLLCQV